MANPNSTPTSTRPSQAQPAGSPRGQTPQWGPPGAPTIGKLDGHSVQVEVELSSENKQTLAWWRGRW